MNHEEFWCFKFLKLQYRRGDQTIKPFCRIGSHQEITCPLFNFRKFQTFEKSTSESCRTHWNLMKDEEFGWFKFPKLKYRRRDQIIQSFCRISSMQETRSTLFNLTKFQKIEISTGEWIGTHWSAVNDEELDSLKFLKFKYSRGDKIIQPFCRIGSHQEISYPFFNLRKFQKIYKSTGESCRTHSNLMNDVEFESFNFLELICRKGDEIIEPFYRIGSTQEIRSPIFNLRKFQKI